MGTMKKAFTEQGLAEADVERPGGRMLRRADEC